MPVSRESTTQLFVHTGRGALQRHSHCHRVQQQHLQELPAGRAVPGTALVRWELCRWEVAVFLCL